MHKKICFFTGLFALLAAVTVISSAHGWESDAPTDAGVEQTPGRCKWIPKKIRPTPLPKSPSKGPSRKRPTQSLLNNKPKRRLQSSRPSRWKFRETISPPRQTHLRKATSLLRSSQSRNGNSVPQWSPLEIKSAHTLGTYRKMPFNTRQNTPDEIISYCLALGCDTEISLIGTEGERRANGIMCLCWNCPCAGYQPLIMIDGHVSARLGYGLRSRPSQLLAALALARVPASYSVHVGNVERSVADLAESEKLSCRTGADLSLKLVGLAYYADAAAWKNDLDEEWSLEKIIKEELAQPVLAPGSTGLDCLMGLSYAVNRREKHNLPLEGQFARAKKYISDYQNYALGLQNSDGSWGYYLSGKGVNRDDVTGLRSSGCMLEWLAISLPEDRLEERGMLAGIAYLINSLNNQHYLNDLPELSTREIAGAMRAPARPGNLRRTAL